MILVSTTWAPTYKVILLAESDEKNVYSGGGRLVSLPLGTTNCLNLGKAIPSSTSGILSPEYSLTHFFKQTVTSSYVLGTCGSTHFTVVNKLDYTIYMNFRGESDAGLSDHAFQHTSTISTILT